MTSADCCSRKTSALSSGKLKLSGACDDDTVLSQELFFILDSRPEQLKECKSFISKSGLLRVDGPVVQVF